MRGRIPTRRSRPPAGVYLQKLREFQNWSQREIQERANLPVQYLSKIETGAISVSGDNIERLAIAYQLTSLQKDEVLALARETFQSNTMASPIAFVPRDNVSDNVIYLECKALYALIALSKESAERVIQVYRAYSTTNDAKAV